MRWWWWGDKNKQRFPILRNSIRSSRENFTVPVTSLINSALVYCVRDDNKTAGCFFSEQWKSLTGKRSASIPPFPLRLLFHRYGQQGGVRAEGWRCSILSSLKKIGGGEDGEDRVLAETPTCKSLCGGRGLPAHSCASKHFSFSSAGLGVEIWKGLQCVCVCVLDGKWALGKRRVVSVNKRSPWRQWAAVVMDGVRREDEEGISLSLQIFFSFFPLHFFSPLLYFMSVFYSKSPLFFSFLFPLSFL